MMPPLMPGAQPASAEERRLLRTFKVLDADARRTLLAFATFLAEKGEAAAAPDVVAIPPQIPLPEPRPAQESVVAAIKRLRRIYPMLDSGTMLHETSALMAAHVLQGRAASAVIDDLEALFATRFAALRDEST